IVVTIVPVPVPQPVFAFSFVVSRNRLNSPVSVVGTQTLLIVIRGRRVLVMVQVLLSPAARLIELVAVESALVAELLSGRAVALPISIVVTIVPVPVPQPVFAFSFVVSRNRLNSPVSVVGTQTLLIVIRGGCVFVKVHVTAPPPLTSNVIVAVEPDVDVVLVP